MRTFRKVFGRNHKYLFKYLAIIGIYAIIVWIIQLYTYKLYVNYKDWKYIKMLVQRHGAVSEIRVMGEKRFFPESSVKKQVYATIITRGIS